MPCEPVEPVTAQSTHNHALTHSRIHAAPPLLLSMGLLDLPFQTTGWERKLLCRRLTVRTAAVVRPPPRIPSLRAGLQDALNFGAAARAVSDCCRDRPRGLRVGRGMDSSLDEHESGNYGPICGRRHRHNCTYIAGWATGWTHGVALHTESASVNQPTSLHTLHTSLTARTGRSHGLHKNILCEPQVHDDALFLRST